MVPLEQFDGDVGFVMYSSSPKKSMTATTIRGCGVICEGGSVIWRRQHNLEKVTQLGIGGVIWRRQHNLEKVTQLGIGGVTWRRWCDLEAAAMQLGIEGSCVM
jgi:hypothetical protein